MTLIDAVTRRARLGRENLIGLRWGVGGTCVVGRSCDVLAQPMEPTHSLIAPVTHKRESASDILWLAGGGRQRKGAPAPPRRKRPPALLFAVGAEDEEEITILTVEW